MAPLVVNIRPAMSGKHEPTMGGKHDPTTGGKSQAAIDSSRICSLKCRVEGAVCGVPQVAKGCQKKENVLDTTEIL